MAIGGLHGRFALVWHQGALVSCLSRGGAAKGKSAATRRFDGGPGGTVERFLRMRFSRGVGA